MTQQTLERPTEAAPTQAPIYPLLTTFDRCDASTATGTAGSIGKKGVVSCGAQAFVRVVLPSGSDLLFCGHHIAEPNQDKSALNAKSEATLKAIANREILESMGARFISQYDSINLKPTDPAHSNGF